MVLQAIDGKKVVAGIVFGALAGVLIHKLLRRRRSADQQQVYNAKEPPYKKIIKRGEPDYNDFVARLNRVKDGLPSELRMNVLIAIYMYGPITIPELQSRFRFGTSSRSSRATNIRNGVNKMFGDGMLTRQKIKGERGWYYSIDPAYISSVDLEGDDELGYIDPGEVRSLHSPAPVIDKTSQEYRRTFDVGDRVVFNQDYWSWQDSEVNDELDPEVKELAEDLRSRAIKKYKDKIFNIVDIPVYANYERYDYARIQHGDGPVEDIAYQWLDIFYEDEYVDPVEVVSLHAAMNKGFILTRDNARHVMEQLEERLDAPFINIYKSRVLGDDKPSIFITVSLDARTKWPNNILENSKYFRLKLEIPNVLYQINKSYEIPKKFRKTKVKDINDLVSKINKYIHDNTPDEYVDPCEVRTLHAPKLSVADFEVGGRVKLAEEYFRVMEHNKLDPDPNLRGVEGTLIEKPVSGGEPEIFGRVRFDNDITRSFGYGWLEKINNNNNDDDDDDDDDDEYVDPGEVKSLHAPNGPKSKMMKTIASIKQIFKDHPNVFMDPADVYWYIEKENSERYSVPDEIESEAYVALRLSELSNQKFLERYKPSAQTSDNNLRAWVYRLRKIFKLGERVTLNNSLYNDNLELMPRLGRTGKVFSIKTGNANYNKYSVMMDDDGKMVHEIYSWNLVDYTEPYYDPAEIESFHAPPTANELVDDYDYAFMELYPGNVVYDPESDMYAVITFISYRTYRYPVSIGRVEKGERGDVWAVWSKIPQEAIDIYNELTPEQKDPRNKKHIGKLGMLPTWDENDGRILNQFKLLAKSPDEWSMKNNYVDPAEIQTLHAEDDDKINPDFVRRWDKLNYYQREELLLDNGYEDYDAEWLAGLGWKQLEDILTRVQLESLDEMVQASWEPGTKTYASAPGVAPRRHKLMTQAIKRKYMKQNKSNADGGDFKWVYTKYFNPYGKGTWYPFWYDGEDMFFGLQCLDSCEFGYFTLSNIENAYATFGGFKLPFERDKYWDEKPIELILNELRGQGWTVPDLLGDLPAPPNDGPGAEPDYVDPAGIYTLHAGKKDKDRQISFQGIL